MYEYLSNGVHGEVLDFPGAIRCGCDLNDALHLLAYAPVDMAETSLLLGETLPSPDPTRTDIEADLEEPIHLILNASSRVKIVPESIYEAA